MSQKLYPNGLRITSVSSDEKCYPELSIPTIDELEEMSAGALSGPSWFVAYLDYRVVIGAYALDGHWDFYRIEKGEELDPKYIQRIRMFNPSEELLLWRAAGGFQGRLRRDSVGSGTDAVVTHQVLFGTRPDLHFKNDGYMKITEDRGTSLILPQLNIEVDQATRICIKTHNYIAYHEKTGQAGYDDSRFVSFTDGQKDLERRNA